MERQPVGGGCVEPILTRGRAHDPLRLQPRELGWVPYAAWITEVHQGLSNDLAQGLAIIFNLSSDLGLIIRKPMPVCMELDVNPRCIKRLDFFTCKQGKDPGTDDL